jgi:glycosyltransferase involved in cell wall biosynthesis
LIKKYGLDKNIFLLGEKDNIDTILPSLDILLHTSLHEGFPNSLCEAQLYSIPVVALESGDIPKIISHSRSGYIAKKGDPKVLSSFCNKLLLDESLRIEFGKIGNEIQRKKIRERRAEKQILELYQI